MSHQEMYCSGCTKPMINKEVTCHHCLNEYHYLPCAGVKEATYVGWIKTKKIDWKCTSCRMKTRYNSTIDSESGITPKRGRENDDEMNNNKEKQQKAESDNDMATDIREIKRMMMEMNNKIETKNNELKSKIMDNLNTFSSTLTKLMEQVNELSEENKKKDKIITTLEIRLNEMEQQTLENNIEISNVTHEENEDLISTTQNITKTIDVEINTNDIKDVYRNRKKNIIIKFTNRTKKKGIMQKAKQKKITNKEGNKIYFNDQLTRSNKNLL